MVIILVLIVVHVVSIVRVIRELIIDSLINSLVRTSNNPSVDNRINNIVKGYKSSNNSINYGFNDRINNSPYKKEWEYLFKCQTESGTYSKSPFLLRSAALLNDIMPVVNVNADNTVGQPSRANADPISDPSGIG
ncbi:hypothetical protein BCR32DRAFT_296150 [Anaeromyces robustus]|uniref:Uncharacterized protein n=1 Tax=Anaeromyces robustus TaxID=1754192 RepID=A0A1Y1WTZ7_9FUNG|nr:hypothetical protein BCR32DRAFT_296150 [Anaeromyces robustus]|eukprot:ORX76614.1 hypothetical protein BCR32DRAFT_296150 [Anaeromyces robustus]